LIKSYKKHYIEKKLLEPVIAIEEESLISQSEIHQKEQDPGVEEIKE
jgi:hypothetical protein